jgi:CDGSH-type Zn-finger protein/uncharacterized Fe-S cluster protein YjdI
MSKKKVLHFKGKEADVSWDGRLCMHMEECWRDKSELFKLGRRPFGQPDLVSTDYILEVARRCPSGAIGFHPHGEAEAETPDIENTVRVAPDGPLYITGDLDIEGAAEDMPSVQFRAALCRCGLSKNKPFCDASHVEAGFKDTGAVGNPGEPLTDTGGVLNVNPAQDGPLLLKGNFTIQSGAGRSTWSGTKAALCRCGQSKNKPFCDGSHRDAGFKSDT